MIRYENLKKVNEAAVPNFKKFLIHFGILVLIFLENI